MKSPHVLHVIMYKIHERWVIVYNIIHTYSYNMNRVMQRIFLYFIVIYRYLISDIILLIAIILCMLENLRNNTSYSFLFLLVKHFSLSY